MLVAIELEPLLTKYMMKEPLLIMGILHLKEVFNCKEKELYCVYLTRSTKPYSLKDSPLIARIIHLKEVFNCNQISGEPKHTPVKPANCSRRQLIDDTDVQLQIHGASCSSSGVKTDVWSPLWACYNTMQYN